MTAFAELVLIGRVVRPQGRKGEVLVEPLSDRPDRYPALRHVFVSAPGGRASGLRVESCWPHKGRYVLKLEGVDTIDAAEALRGAGLGIAEGELAPLPAGSYYYHQLFGLRAQDASGRVLGRVEAVLETGAAPVLVVRGAGGETLVPFAEPFLGELDLAERRLVVRRLDEVEAGPAC